MSLILKGVMSFHCAGRPLAGECTFSNASQ
jgi:hypothetical protein